MLILTFHPNSCCENFERCTAALFRATAILHLPDWHRCRLLHYSHFWWIEYKYWNKFRVNCLGWIQRQLWVITFFPVHNMELFLEYNLMICRMVKHYYIIMNPCVIKGPKKRSSYTHIFVNIWNRLILFTKQKSYLFWEWKGEYFYTLATMWIFRQSSFRRSANKRDPFFRLSILTHVSTRYSWRSARKILNWEILRDIFEPFHFCLKSNNITDTLREGIYVLISSTLPTHHPMRKTKESYGPFIFLYPELFRTYT
jgi:hypothetical protein